MGENVVPCDAWFNGQIDYTLLGDRIDPTQVVEINRIEGGPDDPKARIWLFRRMIGRQAYDTGLNTLVLILLWIFAISWHLTTGSWRHYVSTRQALFAVARFYAWGIFRGEHHAYRKAYWRKHNPLQAMTYLALKLVLFPAIWLTGLGYLSYNLWAAGPGASFWLEPVANLHVFAAFASVAFVVVHVYLRTAGESFVEHLMPMITGFDTVDLTPEEGADLARDEPVRLRPGDGV